MKTWTGQKQFSDVVDKKCTRPISTCQRATAENFCGVKSFCDSTSATLARKSNAEDFEEWREKKREKQKNAHFNAGELTYEQKKKYFAPLDKDEYCRKIRFGAGCNPDDSSDDKCMRYREYYDSDGPPLCWDSCMVAEGNDKSSCEISMKEGYVSPPDVKPPKCEVYIA